MILDLAAEAAAIREADRREQKLRPTGMDGFDVGDFHGASKPFDEPIPGRRAAGVAVAIALRREGRIEGQHLRGLRGTTGREAERDRAACAGAGFVTGRYR